MPDAGRFGGFPTHQWALPLTPVRLPGIAESLCSIGRLRTCEGPSEICTPSREGLGTWTLPVGTAGSLFKPPLLMHMGGWERAGHGFLGSASSG